MVNFEAAFLAIKRTKDSLDDIDTEISGVIRKISDALYDLRFGISVAIAYQGANGEEHWLGFAKINKEWGFTIAYSEDGPTHALLAAPRHIRADVFTPREDDLTPIESLIEDIAGQLAETAGGRGPQLERARAMLAAIDAVAQQFSKPH